MLGHSLWYACYNQLDQASQPASNPTIHQAHSISITVSDHLVANGFENGLLRFYDLRNCNVLYSTKLPHGICSIDHGTCTAGDSSIDDGLDGLRLLCTTLNQQATLVDFAASRANTCFRRQFKVRLCCSWHCSSYLSIHRNHSAIPKVGEGTVWCGRFLPHSSSTVFATADETAIQLFHVYERPRNVAHFLIVVLT